MNNWFEIAETHVAKRSQAHWDAGTFNQVAWQALADEGLWNIAVPKVHGGHGGSWADFAEALQAIAKGGQDLGFCLSMIAHAGVVRSLLNYGSAEQLERFLPLATGGSVGLTALTEPESGSDVARTATIATQVSEPPLQYVDKDVESQGGWVLNGTKSHITHGPVADFGFILGRMDGLPAKEDITVFLTELNPYVQRNEVEDLLGNRTSPTGGFVIKNLPITDVNIVGEPGNGLEIMYDTITLDRLLYGVVAQAFIEDVLPRMVDFSTERVAFGTAIIENQYVQQRLVDLRVSGTQTGLISKAAMDAMLSGSPRANELASMAKMVGSEALLSGAEHAIRITGHSGYENGWVSKLLRDAQGVVIAGGTTEMQKKNIFSQMMRDFTN